jgi:arylsulfatase
MYNRLLSDDGDLMAMRYRNWKVHFMVQDQKGTMEIWQRKFWGLGMPYLFNLRTDPYEFATVTSNTYWDWYIDHAWTLYPLADKFLATFKEFPPRRKAASFTVDQALSDLPTL